MSVPDVSGASITRAVERSACCAARRSRASMRLAQRRLQRGVHAAVAGRGDDDAGAAGVDERVERHARRRRRRSSRCRPPASAGRRSAARSRPSCASPSGQARKARSAAFLDARDRSGVAGAEGVEAIAGGPCGRRAPSARVPADDHDDAARPGRACATATASARFCGPSAGGARRRPHRRREDDRLGRREHALQEVRGLLERVGAVGDDDRRRPRRARGDARRARRARARSRSPCPCCRAARPARSRRRRRPAAAATATSVATGTSSPPGSRRCRRPTPRCRRSCRRCRGRPGFGERFAFWRKLDENTGLDVYSAVTGMTRLTQEVPMQESPEAHRPSTADPRSRPERDRAHRRAADARRDRQRARLQVGQRRRGAPAGARAQGRDRAGRRHVARHSSAV